jgi:hypothetical protein
VKAWQSRPLEPTYAILFFDALCVKVRDEGIVRNKAVYLAIGMRCSGHKEMLGLWIEQTEGATFWLQVMNELKKRGTEDVLIAVVDGLKMATGRDELRFLEAHPTQVVAEHLGHLLNPPSFRGDGGLAHPAAEVL